MSNVIIGTAGHIDHGKTTLIKALSRYRNRYNDGREGEGNIYKPWICLL